jgi:thiol-disulfide isomerase/thioredoxin
MKYLVPVFFFVIGFLSCTSGSSYQIVQESPTTKIVIGKFTTSLLKTDPSFSWYTERYDVYKPDSASTAFLDSAAHSIHFIVFMGTWCGDSKREVPRFFKTIDAANIPRENITMYGVDRLEKDKNHLRAAYNIEKVPTFILFRNDKEIGRIVEEAPAGIERDMVTLIKGHAL